MVLVIFAKAMQRLEKLVKYVPFGHQKAPFGRFSLPKHNKIRGYRDAEGRKTLKNSLGEPESFESDDSTAKRRPPWKSQAGDLGRL